MSDERWHPMATAPKTGEYIDLWARNKDGMEFRVTDCYWHKAQEIWKTQNFTGAGFNKLGKKELLFWRHLPPPPEGHEYP